MVDAMAKAWAQILQVIDGTTIARVLAAFALVALALFIRRFVDLFVVKRVQQLTSAHNYTYTGLLIEAIRKPLSTFILFAGFYGALSAVRLDDYQTFFNQTFRISVAVLVIWMLYRLADVLSVFLSRHFAQSDTLLQRQFLPLLRKTLKTFIVILGVLMVAQNLGYSITSVLTGLGIGGLAVALAAQETLSNFFASIMLLTDMPFRVGDQVKFSGGEGSVEAIGFRSTRLRTAEQTVVSVPNKIFMNTAIENFSKRGMRRIHASYLLSYDTSVDSLELMLSKLKSMLKEDSRIAADKVDVWFDEMKESGLSIALTCFVQGNEAANHLSMKHDLNLRVMRLAQDLGIRFASTSDENSEKPTLSGAAGGTPAGGTALRPAKYDAPKHDKTRRDTAKRDSEPARAD